MEFVVELLSKVVPCEALHACLYEIDSNEMLVIATYGEKQGEHLGKPIGLKQEAMLQIMNSLRPILTFNEAESGFELNDDAFGEIKVKNTLIVRIERGQHVLGLVQMVNSKRERFDASDENLVLYVVEQLGNVLSEHRRSTLPPPPSYYRDSKNHF